MAARAAVVHRDGMDARTTPDAHPARPARTLLAVAIAAWLVLGAARTAALAAEDSGAHLAGAFVGGLLGALWLAWLVRSLVRRVRHRPVRTPGLSPSLFFIAAGLSLLTVASAGGGA